MTNDPKYKQCKFNTSETPTFDGYCRRQGEEAPNGFWLIKCSCDNSCEHLQIEEDSDEVI